MAENDTDESEHGDEMYDDSDDEQFDNCSKDSENSNSLSDDQAADVSNGVSNNDTSVNDTRKIQDDITQNTPAQCESEDINSKECHDIKKEDAGQHDSAEVAESDTSLPGAVMETKQKSPSELEVSPQASLTATLAMTTFSGTFSQPLSVSTSSTNVKSEHIWVPPKLSPQGDAPNPQRTQNCSGQRSPAQVGGHDHFKDDHMVYNQLKDIDNHNSHGKAERPSQGKDFGFGGQRFENLSGVTPARNFQSIEQHLTHNSENERNGVKDEPGQVRTGHVANLEKQLREKEEKIAREREERHRQKIKEERSRKDKEERNRKDREREERKERERKEEKETERRRQEEKERREMAKAQAEINPNKDRSTGTPTMDPSRRPTGGVAEAAAFSDYMRVLAAGHGHTFIPPAMSYMPSIFPIRSQESSIPTHLLHPMSAFGHQLTGLSKDPMLYHPAGGVLSNYGASQFGPVHPLLQRPHYTTHQSLLEYQRSLTAAASAYPWPAAYPYFLHDVAASSSSSASSTSASTAAALAAGVKRPTTEIEAAMELTTKRMRLDGRPPEYTSPWDYFAAAAVASQQQQRVPTMAASLPCGLESASMDKTAEYLRKRYMEYGPHTTGYLSALPEHARPAYYCACADHRDDNIRMWNVEDVCKFLNSLDGCAVYSDHFREQRVTGRILALLTTDHLVKTMGMKLGPAVLLAEAVAKKIQDSNKMSSCEACRSIALSQPMHPMALPL